MDHKRTLHEMIRYTFGGVTTTLINFFSYWAMLEVGVNYRLANLISMVITKSSAYLVNKFFVFQSRCETMHALLREITLYVITRGITGVIEYVGLIILVDICNAGRLFGKCVVLVIITILNYVFGKIVVYRNWKDLK